MKYIYNIFIYRMGGPYWKNTFAEGSFFPVRTDLNGEKHIYFFLSHALIHENLVCKLLVEISCAYFIASKAAKLPRQRDKNALVLM